MNTIFIFLMIFYNYLDCSQFSHRSDHSSMIFSHNRLFCSCVLSIIDTNDLNKIRFMKNTQFICFIWLNSFVQHKKIDTLRGFFSFSIILLCGYPIIDQKFKNFFKKIRKQNHSINNQYPIRMFFRHYKRQRNSETVPQQQQQKDSKKKNSCCKVNHYIAKWNIYFIQINLYCRKVMQISTHVTFLLVLLIDLINTQTLQYNGYIETRKLSLFGPDSGVAYSQLNQTHNFLFKQNFNSVPRVGLSVYTIDFEYSLSFSCQVTADTNQTSGGILFISQTATLNDILYVMYIATDNDQIGIFIPGQLNTTLLSIPERTQRLQIFDFNFKQEISVLASISSDITSSIYLTGISTTSEMTTNGFFTNRTSVSLRIISVSTIFYSIEVSINSNYNQVLIDWVMCTVVYFIPKVMINNRYQINAGVVTLMAFGGTISPSTQSIDLLPLPQDNRFTNLNFFFGISTIDCRDGESIALLGVQKYHTGSNNSNFLLLQMQTWSLVFIVTSSFNYIQYNTLKCNQPGANCITCSQDLKPYYIVNNICNYCHYSCFTCNVSLSDAKCDTCHVTRIFNSNTSLCDCKPGYYDTRMNYTCESCFPCGTCQNSNSCTTCLTSQNMVFNSVTRQCLCAAGFYPNLLDPTNHQSYSTVTLCLKCGPNCLYCTSSTACKACDMGSYLLNGSCIPICKANERFTSTNNTCSSYWGELFNQQGRLSYQWSLTTINNEMIITLIFSQPNVSFYYYENGRGYTYFDMTYNSSGRMSNASVYYDDGLYFAGYGEGDDVMGSGGLSGNGIGAGNNSQSYSTIDQSTLLGQYYGYGELTFFQLLYQNFTVFYRDNNMLPYGKYNLSTATSVGNLNYIDALSKNLLFKIQGHPISYTIQSKSSNQFTILVSPIQTYMNAHAVLEIKNLGLIRADNTAVQHTNVSLIIDRFDFYTQQQLTTALQLQTSNSIFVGILWGLSKYLLFIGFGWSFIPLMLSLQIVMSLNYINSNIPLNLKSFLASFSDFRNPSILYNPMRNYFDQQVLSHQNIYKSISQFEVFDRGIDFMKNSFEFFFVPLLACILLGLLFLLNLIFRKFFNREFALISKYLVPRLPLLIGAYTLVQALPVSFFFFAQLKDTTFRHPLQPSAAYPTFNTAMAYLGFFLTCAIPILLLAWLYYHFNYGVRISQFSDANVFNRKFLNKIDNTSGQFSRAQFEDPLWGGDPSQMGSYIFGILVFGLLIMFGFLLSFFISHFGWQMAGLLVFSLLFLALVIRAKYLKDKVIKCFFIILMTLMIGYLLLHAGLGSNISSGTYNQWNTGFFAISLIYSFILTALVFSIYLVYQTFRDMYNRGKKQGWWVNLSKKNEMIDDVKEVRRVTEYRNDTRLKSTFLKGVKSSGNNVLGRGNNLGSQNKGLLLNSNLKKSPLQDLDYILPSQQRMITRSYDPFPQTQNYQALILIAQDTEKQQVTFISNERKMIFTFPQQKGRMLLQRQPLYIDKDCRIYDKYKIFIDFYRNLCKKHQTRTCQQLGIQSVRNIIPLNQTITTTKEIYVINDEQYEKVEEEKDGVLKLKSYRTGELMTFDLANMRDSFHFQSGISSRKRLQSNHHQYIQNTTQHLISSSQGSSNQQLINGKSKTSIICQNQQINDEINNLSEFEEGDAINPEKFYKIFGIPEEKVVDFEFDTKDIQITQRTIKGNEVLQKIQSIQQKYPKLLLLIRSESNDSEEFWIK